MDVPEGFASYDGIILPVFPEEILSCPIQIIFDNYVYGVQSVVRVYPYYEPNDEGISKNSHSKG